MKNTLFLILFLILSFLKPIHAQIVDEVVGIVGNKVILKSDIETQILQMGINVTNTNRFATECSVLEELLLQKMLLTQADIDSINVTDSQVDGEIDRRISYFVSEIGSEKKVEEYFKKSLDEIRRELRETISDQIKVEQVQSKISGDIKVTPSEVKIYFETIPIDSIPMVDAVVTASQLVKFPKPGVYEIKEAKEKLNEFRMRIIKGESFTKLARLYSEDPGSAAQGGELGFYGRGKLYPEFEAVAFGLKEGEVSDVIETQAGFHIIQMIKRKGEEVNVRHILISPKVPAEGLVKAQKQLDSIAILIRKGVMSFEDAAAKFSDDESKNNGGIIVNPLSGNARFEMSNIKDKYLYYALSSLKEGEMSQPELMQTSEGKKGVRIVKLNSRVAPHRANLKDDYQLIQNAALVSKKMTTMKNWVAKMRNTIYIEIKGGYRGCEFDNNWFN